MEKNELKQEFGTLATDFLATLDTKVAEIKKSGVADPTTVDKLEKLNGRLDEMETKFNRAKIWPGQNQKSSEEKSEEYKAYASLMRYGAGGIEPEERKLIRVHKASKGSGPEEVKILTETDDTGGGYLAPPEFLQEILKGIILYSPVRNLARVRTTSLRSVRVPKRTGTFAAQWVAEIATRTETTGLTYGLEEIPVHELYALSDISNADLEDSAFDLNGELQMEFSEQFAKAEGTGFVNGTAVGQPEGYMINPAVATDVTGSASALTYNGYVTCAFNLKSAYAPNATWGMNRKTLGLTRQIVDSNGRPIWMPFSSSGMDIANPPNILGIPYQELPDMPDVGTSLYPVVIADWKRAYMIVDRISIEIQRDPYTQNVKGVTRFIARKRVGGQIVLAEAMRKLQCHT